MAVRNIIVQRPDTRTLVAHLNKGEVLYFDGEGRFREARLAGISFRRGLKGQIFKRWRHSAWEPAGDCGRFLTPDENDQLLKRIQVRLTEDTQQGRVRIGLPSFQSRQLEPASPQEERGLLELLLGWDIERYRADSRAFESIYSPVGILPPDRYRSLVVQATRGCSYNDCDFCSLYQDVPFEVLKTEEFRSHVRSVKKQLGRGITAYRSFFLGSANPLLLPTEKLEALLEVLDQEFQETPGLHPSRGVHAFIDAFTGKPKTTEEYSRLHALGLQTLYVGLETGSDSLRGHLHKPGTTEDCLQLVASAKAGGLSIGVMILIGPGGRQWASKHEQKTIEALRDMNLGDHDRIFLSPLITPHGEGSGSETLDDSSLDSAERDRQIQTLIHAIPLTQKDRPRIRPYHVGGFLY